MTSVLEIVDGCRVAGRKNRGQAPATNAGAPHGTSAEVSRGRRFGTRDSSPTIAARSPDRHEPQLFHSGSQRIESRRWRLPVSRVDESRHPRRLSCARAERAPAGAARSGRRPRWAARGRQRTAAATAARRPDRPAPARWSCRRSARRPCSARCRRCRAARRPRCRARARHRWNQRPGCPMLAFRLSPARREDPHQLRAGRHRDDGPRETIAQPHGRGGVECSRPALTRRWIR